MLDLLTKVCCHANQHLQCYVILLLEVWTKSICCGARLGPKYLPYLLYLCHLSKIFSPSKPQLRENNSTHHMVMVGEVVQGSVCTVSSRILAGQPVLKHVSCCYCSNKRERTLSVCPRQSEQISPKRQVAVEVM